MELNEERDAVKFENNLNNYRRKSRININNILKWKQRISGSHPVDPIKSKEWIDSQLTSHRRFIAQKFIDNIHYITLDQTFEYMRLAVIKLYSKFPDGKFNVFTGNRDTSNYFMSLVALYHIISLNYPEPEEYIMDWGHSIFIDPDVPLVIFDDCIYSGGQSYIIMENITMFANIKSFYICSAVITNVAIRKYSFEDPNYISGFSKPTDYSIDITYGHIVPDLWDVVGPEIYFDMRYYFSFFTNGSRPPSIIYFDHKIADSVSTFKLVLQVGPIIPPIIDYPHSLVGYSDDNLRDVLYEWINPTKDVIENSRKRIQYMEKEPINKPFTRKFIPFITGCEIIPDLDHVPYRILQIGIHTNKEPYYRDYKKYIDKLYDKRSRCPKSTYKDILE